MVNKSEIPRVAVYIDTDFGLGGEIIRGILSYVQRTSPWDFLLKSEIHETFPAFPQGWDGDGIICFKVNEEDIRDFEAHVPVVNISCNSVATAKINIAIDEFASAALAVEYFRSLGYQNLAFVGCKTSLEYGKQFAEVVAGSGRQCSLFTLVDGAEDLSVHELVKWLISLTKPVGLVGGDAALCRKLVDCCKANGIHVPEDIAVLSIREDSIICNACYPAVSGIDIPLEKMGELAAIQLSALMAGQQVLSMTYVEPSDVVKRKSTDVMAIDDSKMIEVINYIRNNACKQITVDDVLSKVPMARTTMERRFRDILGRTPSKEIRRIRLDKAKTLLDTTDMQIAEIAEECGYSNYNYFSYVFKRVVGISPRAYRNQYTNPSVVAN